MRYNEINIKDELPFDRGFSTGPYILEPVHPDRLKGQASLPDLF
jgi:hypothetical protein